MLRLNLGCGNDLKEGYVNIDVRSNVGADIVMDIENDSLPFDDNSVDEILAKDVIEHFSFRNVERVVRDWHRVLKTGGILTIQTPDFEQIVAEWYKGNIDTWFKLSYWLYGGQDYSENTHKLIFTKIELTRFLTSIGFRIVEIWNGGTNMVCKAVKV